MKIIILDWSGSIQRHNIIMIYILHYDPKYRLKARNCAFYSTIDLRSQKNKNIVVGTNATREEAIN